MRVNPAAFASGDHLDPLGGVIQGGNGQEEPESREGTDRANLRFLEIPSVGLVIKKRLLDIEAQAVLLEGLQAGGFIADDGPKLTIDTVLAKGDMDRAIPLAFVEVNAVPIEGLPPLKMVSKLKYQQSSPQSANAA